MRERRKNDGTRLEEKLVSEPKSYVCSKTAHFKVSSKKCKLLTEKFVFKIFFKKENEFLHKWKQKSLTNRVWRQCVANNKISDSEPLARRITTENSQAGAILGTGPSMTHGPTRSWSDCQCPDPSNIRISWRQTSWNVRFHREDRKRKPSHIHVEKKRSGLTCLVWLLWLDSHCFIIHPPPQVFNLTRLCWLHKSDGLC